MLFNSWEFFLFFPIVTTLYFLFPHRYRWSLLLTASCLFYMAFVPKYIFILFGTIVVDYFAGIWIEKSQGRTRKILLWLSVFVTAAILFVFKYFNFFNQNMAELARLLHWNYSIEALSLILPVGLSFHTFQSLSYVIEVYHGRQKAERHFGIYSLYVMFYPQLVAGPIERPQNVIHQIHEEHRFSYEDMTVGLKMMAWGLFKKVVVADRIAKVIEKSFDQPGNYSPLVLAVTALLFTIQVYCDFSGYSDIALGSARTMGYRLMVNFNRPYWSTSLSEFWKRWHISLSTWLKDYIFTPLTIELRDWGIYSILFGLTVTFVFSGLWHGAAWTFVVWGFFHAMGLCFEAITQQRRKKLGKKLNPYLFTFLGWLATFTFLNFSYIFFRAKSMAVATDFLRGLFAFSKMDWAAQVLQFNQYFSSRELNIIIIGVLVIETFEYYFSKKPQEKFLSLPQWWIRWPVYYTIVYVLIVYGEWFGKRDFIYFQF